MTDKLEEVTECKVEVRDLISKWRDWNSAAMTPITCANELEAALAGPATPKQEEGASRHLARLQARLDEARYVRSPEEAKERCAYLQREVEREEQRLEHNSTALTDAVVYPCGCSASAGCPLYCPAHGQPAAPQPCDVSYIGTDEETP